MLAEAFAIACFISPNLSPMEWMVSGSKADVDAAQAAVLAIPKGEVLDRASGGWMDFALFQLPATVPYGEVMGLMNRAHALHTSFPKPETPSCPGGRAEDAGDAYAPVVVAILGETESLSQVKAQVPWANFIPVNLADGRTGFAFQPEAEQFELYQAFVASAAAGKFTDAQVILLRPTQESH